MGMFLGKIGFGDMTDVLMLQILTFKKQFKIR